MLEMCSAVSAPLTGQTAVHHLACTSTADPTAWQGALPAPAIRTSLPICAPGKFKCCASNPEYRKVMDEWVAQGFTLRYSRGMVPDVHHLLIKVRPAPALLARAPNSGNCAPRTCCSVLGALSAIEHRCQRSARDQATSRRVVGCSAAPGLTSARPSCDCCTSARHWPWSSRRLAVLRSERRGQYWIKCCRSSMKREWWHWGTVTRCRAARPLCSLLIVWCLQRQQPNFRFKSCVIAALVMCKAYAPGEVPVTFGLLGPRGGLPKCQDHGAGQVSTNESMQKLIRDSNTNAGCRSNSPPLQRMIVTGACRACRHPGRPFCYVPARSV
jgi:hypothetical protein